MIAATTDPDHPDDVFNVKDAAGQARRRGRQGFRLLRLSGAHEALAGKPVVVQVLRVMKAAERRDDVNAGVNVLVPPAFHATLGMRMKMGEVAAMRDRSPASDKVQPGDEDRRGDA